ncbi:DNA polymerase [uncultured phage cr19_1]|uniref:DNA polymerase n=1 Tax=uncultured phage cr19_1 TaxID=2986420 RepID=A0AAE7RWR2_9CAUD|nr:DNA polymerase [uncultured phage cr19_1]QWM90844.1 DNA polymerase [uncultured phage cr19_1]
MQIRGKAVFVFDIEVFQNIFHCSVKDTETNTIYKFEISERKNQLRELVKFFKQVNKYITWGEYYTTTRQIESNIIFCGYNNLHYDNPIINYIIEYEDTLMNHNVFTICSSIFNLSKTITTSKEDNIDAWKHWKYQIWFDTFDILTMLYSNKLRVGLKEIQVTMQYPNVQEFVCDWTKPLPLEDFDSMIDYNINDIESTSELLNRCKDAVDLRIAIEDEYGVRVLSKDGVNIGMKILTQKYLEKTGLTWWDIEGLRSPMDYIPLKDVILPFIKYDSTILNRVLEDMKDQIVSPGRKGYENNFVFAGLRYTVGVGGIHSKNDPEIIIPKEDEMLIDIDVASLYPSMLIEYGFYPKHLGPEFLEVYSQIKNERIEAKHNGDKVKNETLKLALNGLSGNLQNEHNFCYSPEAVMKIRINGQLLLLMLAEKLTQVGCRIIQANTDGLFVLLKKDNYQQVNTICRNWEQLTKLTLEEERFEAMYQYAINDYIAVTTLYPDMKKRFLSGETIIRKSTKKPYTCIEEIQEDFIKTKGMFITKVLLGKGLSAKIIPEAIIKYFVDGIPVEQTIKECKDIKKFLMSEKTGKQWHVEYMNEEQQRTNRFYASTNGGYLWKWKDTGHKEGEIITYTEPYVGEHKYKASARQYQNMLTASGVTLLNKFDDKPIEERKINYRYYLREALKIIEELQPRQLELF